MNQSEFEVVFTEVNRDMELDVLRVFLSETWKGVRMLVIHYGRDYFPHYVSLMQCLDCLVVLPIMLLV